MKYYVYISDAKVEMLLPQITQVQKKKLATEFKIDLKILSASRKAETELSDDRIKRLEVVCEFIREYGNLGTADTPNEYIEDIIPMSLTVIKAEPACVYYSGFTDKTILGLGGSLKHMIGSESASGARDVTNISGSQHVGINDTLNEWLEKEEQEVSSERAEGTFDPVMETSLYMRKRPRSYPLQRLQFLAKRLHQVKYTGVSEEAIRRSGLKLTDEQLRSQFVLVKEGTNLVLATPLYVAMAE